MSMTDDNKSLRTLEAFEARLAQSEKRLLSSEDEIKRGKAQLRATWSVALAGTIGTLILGLGPRAQAQYGVTIASLDTRLKSVEISVNGLNKKTQFMGVSDTTTQFVGTNVQIVSGGGSTDASVNGLGNLIIGYNQLRSGSPNVRTGSHNLILGDGNDYSSYGGLVAGQFNTLAAPYASILSGLFNTVSGPYASITGGRQNTASGVCASISGGANNTASESFSSVSGGQSNTASGDTASVSGGQSNTASGVCASISGGQGLNAIADSSWKAGYFSFP